MAQSIIGLENVQPYKFSECSRSDYIDALRIGHGLCLLNKPNEVGVSKLIHKKFIYPLYPLLLHINNSSVHDEIVAMALLKMAKSVTVDHLMTVANEIHVVTRLHVSL